MNQLDKLTPTLILICGSLINHVCKDHRPLTVNDMLLYLSPSIPTIIPIFIDMFKSFVASWCTTPPAVVAAMDATASPPLPSWWEGCWKMFGIEIGMACFKKEEEGRGTAEEMESASAATAADQV